MNNACWKLAGTSDDPAFVAIAPCKGVLMRTFARWNKPRAWLYSGRHLLVLEASGESPMCNLFPPT